jgi:hypothetical protein
MANDFLLRVCSFDTPKGYSPDAITHWEECTLAMAKVYFDSFKFTPGAEPFMALVDARGWNAGEKHYCEWLNQLIGEAAIVTGKRRAAIRSMPFAKFIEQIAAPIRQKPEPPAFKPRIEVRRNPPSVTLDGGNPQGLTDEQAAFLEILFANLGQWVEPERFERDPTLKSVRIDRILNGKKFPKAFRALIEGKPGTGYRMTLP